MSPRPSFPRSSLDALEFEATTLEDARAVIDELPAGLAHRGAESTLGSIGEPSLRLRKSQAPRDRSVNAMGWAWLEELPPEVRPHELPILFPHIVNRMALVWSDREEAMTYLLELMVDDRGDRRGFPMKIAQELAQLREWREQVLRPAR
jgi:hypothetical protein